MDDIVKNAVTCRICQSPADLHNGNIYICQSNPNHIGDTMISMFTDMTYNPVQVQHEKEKTKTS